MREFDCIFLSCEHAANQVPRQYRYLFTRTPDVLKTHRGYDVGIEPVADRLSKLMRCPLIKFPLSRLLIEPNRSQRHRLFSVYSRRLPASDKAHLIRAYYLPYRDALRRQVVSARQGSKTVLHLSLHSFTPVLKGKKRNADIGLLYDPSRPKEVLLAQRIQERLAAHLSLRVRRNYPYRGTADGTVTWLRRQFRVNEYMGLEIELNQARLLSHTTRHIQVFCKALSLLLTQEE